MVGFDSIVWVVAQQETLIVSRLSFIMKNSTTKFLIAILLLQSIFKKCSYDVKGLRYSISFV